MDTQLRSLLYYLSVGDLQDVKTTLDCVRCAVKDIQGSTKSSLKKVMLRNAADTQKIATLQQHASHLSMEKSDLQVKVNGIKVQLEAKC